MDETLNQPPVTPPGQDAPVSIDTNTVQEEGVQIDTGTPAPTVPSTEVATSRAAKAHAGLGETVKQDYATILKQMQEGREKAFRDNAALAITQENDNKRLEKMKQMTAQLGRGLTLEEFQDLQNNPDRPFNRLANPDTVIEKGFGTWYVSNINKSSASIENTVLDNAAAEMPDQLSKFLDQGSDLASKREWWLKKAEDLDAVVQDQSWTGWGADQAKQLIPFYNEIQNRGNTPGVGRFTGGLLGENMEAQGIGWFRMPLDEMSSQAEEILKKMSVGNPSLARDYAHAMAGMSTSDKIVNDAMTPLEIMGGYDAIKLGKGLLRKVDVYNRANKAVQDAVKSTAVPEMTPKTVAEGMGDTKEAGVQGAVSIKNAGLQGVDQSLQKSIDTLLSGNKTRVDAIASDTTLSRELQTRLLNAEEGFANGLIDTVVNTAKIERVPFLTAMEGTYRLLADKIKEYYPGKANTIADVNIYRDPISGATMHDIHVVNYDGTQFISKEAAENHALINGYGEARVVESEGKLPTQVSRDLQSEIDKTRRNIEGGQVQFDRQMSSIKRGSPQPTRWLGEGPLQHTDNIARGEGAITKQELKDTISSAKQTREWIKGQKAKLADLQSQLDRQGKWQGEGAESTKNYIGEGPAVQQQGLGFHLVITKPLNETQSFIRDGLIYSKDARSSSSETGWRGFANSLIGGIRGANDTLSLAETTQRLKAVYTQSRFQQLAQQEMNYVADVVKGVIRVDPITGEKLNIGTRTINSIARKLSGGKSEVFDQFNRTLQAARTTEDPVTKLPGYWFQNPSELHSFYQSSFNRAPSFEETSAYFAFVRAYEYDLAMRNIRSYANKARLGAQRWSFSTVLEGAKTQSSEFEGVQLKNLPGSADTILVHGVNDGEKLYSADAIPKNQYESLKKDIQEGRKVVVEVYDPEARILKRKDAEGNNARIRYVISDAMASRPLSYDQIGRRGGGHIEYDYDHYIKQAKMRSEFSGGRQRYWYEGDQTLMPIDNRVKGRDIAKVFDDIRVAIKNKDLEAAKAIVASKTDLNWKDVHGWFRQTKDVQTGEMIEPRFNVDEKFHVVPKGSSVAGIDKELETRINSTDGKFVDGTRHGSLARNFQVQYTGQRDAYDLFSLKPEGNRYNPVYKYQPAEVLDPIPVTTRALDRIVNSLYMDDYKIMSAEHWLQENKGLLRKTDQQIRATPFAAFREGADKANYRIDADKVQVANAMSNHAKIQNLIGTPSTFDTNMHTMKQMLHDFAYDKLGQKGEDLVPDWLLDRVTSPVDFARSMAYHLKLGLFNASQLVTQNVTYITIAALAPKHVTQGTFGAMMHQWSRLTSNPEVLNGLGKFGEMFGWKPGQMKEAMDVLDRVGFANVAGDYSVASLPSSRDYIKTNAAQFFDAGQIFFKGAERNVRYGAWYTAFHEWRTANPLLTIGDKESGDILRRADDLYGNMSRASNSYLNKGLLSVPAQFLSYQYRLAELFWSKRIGETVAERTKSRAIMYATYAAAFGVPGALGLSGLPLGDIWRKKALENGYNIGEGAAETMAMEGIPSMIGALITGKGDFQSGNFYNWNDKMGANGFSPLKEMLRSDPSIWKVFGGAAGSVVGNTLANGDGWFKAMNSMITGKQGEEAFPMTATVWLDLANEASGFSSARKAIYALNYGKWVNRSEQPVDDNVSKTNALFMAAMGLNPQEMDDAFLKSWTKDDEKAVQKQANKQFQKFFRRAVIEADNNDEQYKATYAQAFGFLTASGYPRENWDQAIALATRGYETTVNRSDYSFYLKDVPEGRKEVAQEAYRTRLKLNEHKNQ